MSLVVAPLTCESMMHKTRRRARPPSDGAAAASYNGLEPGNLPTEYVVDSPAAVAVLDSFYPAGDHAWHRHR